MATNQPSEFAVNSQTAEAETLTQFWDRVVGLSPKAVGKPIGAFLRHILGQRFGTVEALDFRAFRFRTETYLFGEFESLKTRLEWVHKPESKRAPKRVLAKLSDEEGA